MEKKKKEMYNMNGTCIYPKKLVTHNLEFDEVCSIKDN